MFKAKRLNLHKETLRSIGRNADVVLGAGETLPKEDTLPASFPISCPEGPTGVVCTGIACL